MTSFIGTAGIDTVLGADFVADDFFFDATTLSGSDVIVGGLTAGFGDLDTVHLAAGSYAAADFAGMSEIEQIVLDGPATLEVDTAMLAQSGGGGLVIYTSTGDDVIDATTVGFGGGRLQVVLGGGNDTVYGSSYDEVFTVGVGAVGNYTLFGGDGFDDFDIFGTGSHVLDGGGDDHDVLWLNRNVGAADLDLRAAGTQLSVNGGLLQASVTGIEVFYATNYDDVLRGDSGDQDFWGLTGDDILDGRGGSDGLMGDAGNDILRGGAGNDGLDGGDGIDTADYAGAIDDLDIDLTRAVDQAVGTGASGTDQLTSIENVIGGDGEDIIAGDAGTNVIHGGGGNDTLLGREGDDLLYGDDGNDVLDAGTGFGADLIDGGAGLDRADFSVATTDVFVNLASDYGSDGLTRFWTLLDIEGAIGGSANDSLYGDDENNRFDGRQGADDLHGLDGDDQLRGGNGADTLDGGSGDDLLTGGNGTDVFIFSDSGSGFGADTVQDFQDGLDTLEFHGVGTVVVNDVAGDAFIDMFDTAGAYLETVRLIGAAGQVDTADYVLVP